MRDGSGQPSVEREDPDIPDTRQFDRTKPRRPRHLAALIVGLVGLLAGLAVPLAPVIADDVTVHWPQAGRPAESTLAFFVPYEPAEVHVRVPCSAVHSGQRPAAATTLVSSSLPGAPTKGFSVTTGGGEVLVLVGGAEILRAPATGDCAVALDVDAKGSTARIGDRTVTHPDRRVEEINAFATDLPPQQANGIRVTATTANWFENIPTPGKQALIVLQLTTVALAVALLVAEDRGRAIGRVVADRIRQPGRLRRGLLDLGVFCALGAWWVLGPTTPDDSFASMTVRNGLRIGDIGNYYRWENASESPFTLVQHLLEPVAELSVSPLAMRLPSVLAGALTWLLLSRGVLAVVLPEHGRRLAVRALAALSFLAWWLPFGLGVRPEAFAALALTAVLAFLLLAVHSGRLVWLGLAALAGGLSIAVNVMGICLLAPVIVLAPRLWRLMRGPGLVAWLALLAGLGATGLVAIFVDQSLFGVRQATRLHTYYGPDVPWFQEIQRYEYLFGFNLEGDIARRTPVVLTIVVLMCCAFLFSRGARSLTGMRLAHVPALCMVISLGLLWLTPSKWTHYFGALAGFGAATLTTGAVLILIVARPWAGHRSVALLGSLGTVLSVIAAALAFAGKNNWFSYSHFGVPWGEGPVRPLDSPATWLLLVALVIAGSALAAAARKNNSDHAVRGMIIRMPVVISTLAMGVTVSIMLGSFVLAPLRQSGSYSVGGQNLASAFGSSCGIADHIVVTPDLPGGELAPAQAPGDIAELSPFTENGSIPEDPPDADRAWSSADAGSIATGGFTSEWFDLPALPRDRELALSIAGRTGDGNRLWVEFGHTEPDAIRPLGRHVLDDTDEEADELPAYPTDHIIEDEPQDRPAWRAVPIPHVPEGADRIRVHAFDGTTDSGGWLAMSAPRVREVIPMTEYLRDRGAVLVDWSMTWAFPCVHDFPHVGRGLAEPPGTLIIPAASFGFGGEAAYSRSIGGSFAGVPETGTQREIPTRLLGLADKPQYREWGHLMAVEYPLPGNQYDVHSARETRWGWRGD